MAIVSSSYVVGHAQADGRRYITESHTDSIGVVRTLEYGPVGVVDYAGIMAARAAAMSTDLAVGEAAQAFDVAAAPVLVHQTSTELAARFREAYRNASDTRQAKLAKWILARITAGDYTDAQVRNAFGLTPTQYNAMKTRMATLRDQYDGVMAARGE